MQEIASRPPDETNPQSDLQIAGEALGTTTEFLFLHGISAQPLMMLFGNIANLLDGRECPMLTPPPKQTPGRKGKSLPRTCLWATASAFATALMKDTGVREIAALRRVVKVMRKYSLPIPGRISSEQATSLGYWRGRLSRGKPTEVRSVYDTTLRNIREQCQGYDKADKVTVICELMDGILSVQ